MYFISNLERISEQMERLRKGQYLLYSELITANKTLGRLEGHVKEARREIAKGNYLLQGVSETLSNINDDTKAIKHLCWQRVLMLKGEIGADYRQQLGSKAQPCKTVT